MDVDKDVVLKPLKRDNQENDRIDALEINGDKKELTTGSGEEKKKLSFFWIMVIIFEAIYILIYLTNGGVLWSRLLASFFLAGSVDALRALVKKEKAQTLSWILAIVFLILVAITVTMDFFLG